MPVARARRARRIAASSPLWALGVIAIGCVYPQLSTSPDWQDEALGGDGADAGSGGVSSNGGRSGSAGRAGAGNDAGNGPEPIGGDGSGGEGGTPGPDIIVATVVDQEGLPVAGVPILIDALELETDENGEASTPGEGRESYTATIVSVQAKSATVYEGLSRRKLHFLLSNLDFDTTGKLQGTVTTDLPADDLQFNFVDPQRKFSFFGAPNFTDVSPSVRYEITPLWSGGNVNGRVLGFNSYIGAGYTVPNELHFGSVEASLTPGATVSGLDFTLSQLDTRELPVTITVPSGATRGDFFLLGPFSLSNPTPPSGSLTYYIPDDEDFDDAGRGLQFLATCAFGPDDGANSSVFVQLSSDVDSIDEACPLPPEQTSPADKALDVTRDTPLVFEPAQAGCNSVFATRADVGWAITVYTLASEVVLPDLSAWGIDYAGHKVDWTASTTSPCESIDGLVAPPTAAPVSVPPTTFARSVHRTFTTAP